MAGLTEKISVLIEGSGLPLISEFHKIAAEGTKTFTTVSAQAEAMSKKVEVAQARLANAKSPAAIANAEAALTKAKVAAEQFAPAAGLAGQALEKLGIAGVGAGTALKAGLFAAGAVAVAAVAKAAQDGIASWEQLAEQTRVVQHTMGGSAEQASTLASVMRRLGVDVESSSKPLAKFGQNVAEHPEKLGKYAIAIAKTKDGHVDLVKTLENVSAAWRTSGDAAQRDSILLDVFGAKGASADGVVRLLAQDTGTWADSLKKAQEHGEVLSDAQVNKIIEFKHSMEDASNAVKLIERDLAGAFIPQMTSAAKAVDALVSSLGKIHIPSLHIPLPTFKAGSAPRAVEDFLLPTSGLNDEAKKQAAGHHDNADAARQDAAAQSAFGAAENSEVAPTKSATEAIREQKSARAELVSAAKDVRSAERSVRDDAVAEKKAHEAVSKAEQDVTKAHKDVEKAIQGVSKAQREAVKAHEAVGKAVEGVSRAQREAVKAHEDVAKAIDNVAKAEREVLKAHENVAKAVEHVGDAEKELHKLLEKGPVDWKAVASAQREASRAAESTQRAQENLAKAIEHLNQVAKGASIDELTDAELRLEGATLGAAHAQRNLTKAREDLLKSQIGAEGSADLADAQLAFADASLQVREANQQQKESQEALNTTRQKGSILDQEYISAQQAVRDAVTSLSDAEQSQADTEQRLREARAGDPEFADKVAQAQRNVRDAVEGVKDAQQAERDAQDNVRAATEAVADAQQRERDAQEAVHTATEAVADAQDRERDAQAAVGQATDAVAEAKQREGDARQHVADAQDAVGRAEENSRDAAETLAGAQERLSDAFNTAATVLPGINTELDALIQKYPQLASIIQSLQQQLAAAPPGWTPGNYAAYQAQYGHNDTAYPNSNGLPPGATQSSLTFAEGGIVDSTTLAIIGEAGPEAILPLTKPGRMVEILNRLGLLKPLAGKAGGATLNIHGDGGGSATDHVVNVYLDGQLITSYTARAMESRRRARS